MGGWSRPREPAPHRPGARGRKRPAAGGRGGVTAPGCLDPAHCPVPNPDDVDLRKLRLHRRPAGVTFHTAYRRSVWPALFNPSGLGNARFSPLALGGVTVPTLYGASTQTVALLESSFHGVHEAG